MLPGYARECLPAQNLLLLKEQAVFLPMKQKSHCIITGKHNSVYSRKKRMDKEVQMAVSATET